MVTELTTTTALQNYTEEAQEGDRPVIFHGIHPVFLWTGETLACFHSDGMRAERKEWLKERTKTRCDVSYGCVTSCSDLALTQSERVLYRPQALAI